MASLLARPFIAGRQDRGQRRETHVTSLDLTNEINTWPLVLELEEVYRAEEATGCWYGVADGPRTATCAASPA